jgi:hypothetical protein
MAAPVILLPGQLPMGQTSPAKASLTGGAPRILAHPFSAHNRVIPGVFLHLVAFVTFASTHETSRFRLRLHRGH